MGCAEAKTVNSGMWNSFRFGGRPLLIVLLTLAAQAEPLSLRQAGQSALQQHPTGREAFARVQADRARFGQSQAPFYPTLTAGVDYLTNDQREDNEVTYEQSTGLNLVASQLLGDFGKRRNSSKRAELSYQATEQADLAVRQTLLDSVAKAYFGLLSAAQSVFIQKEALRLAKLRRADAQVAFEKGTRPLDDLSLAEADMSNILVDLIEAQTAERNARVRLGTAMGQSEPFRGSLLTCSMPYREWEERSALRTATDSRPDLADARLRTEAAEKGIRLAEAGYRPDLYVTAGYGYLDKGFVPQDYLWEVRLNLSFPLLNEPFLSQTVALAEAETEQAKAREDGRVNEVAGEVQTALVNLDASYSQTRAAHRATLKAYKNLTLTWTTYRLGGGSARDVSNSQRDLTQALVSQNQIFTEYQLALVEMHRATGQLSLDVFPAGVGDERNLFWPFFDQEIHE
jgi:outer membrane protein TolC